MEPLRYEIEHGVGTGHFVLYRKQDHVFSLHMHRCYELVLMRSGSMRLWIETQEYLLEEGDLVLIKPNRLHRYDTPEHMHGACDICVFSTDLIAAVAEELLMYRLPSPVIRGVPELYRRMFAEMDERADVATVKGFVYSLCGLFYRNLEVGVQDDTAKDTHLLRDVLVHLEKNMGEPCMLKDTAHALGYSPAHLSRYFKANVGMPYYAYVQAIKIDRACYLLTNTDHSVLSVAIQCGFTTLSSFNRTFRMLCGMTPREYRNGYAKQS